MMFVFSGCSGREPDNVPFSKRFQLQLGTRTIHVQVALDEAEIRNGLMFRESLEEDEGMLFVFKNPQKMSFWMRNTKIPLDVGYFSPDGELMEVYPLYPYNENPVESRSDNLQYVLEMNQGWFAGNDVPVGTRLELKALAEILRKRGFNPAEYSLPGN